jgi:hypothetical protein
VVFEQLTLEVEDKGCTDCGSMMSICDHRHRRVFTLKGPLRMTMKLTHCPKKSCPRRTKTVSAEAELGIAVPNWAIAWDVFVWIGHRRFSRHWTVGQIRGELIDSYGIRLSEDAIEKYIKRYEVMLAARQQDAEQLRQAYEGIDDLILSIDGLQPEKGHETLYVVRELRGRRVWFAEPLLSSAEGEIRKLVEKAGQWAEQLGKPVRGWVSDKQEAFVKTIGKVFPGVPHRYCQNHFMRDLAKPVLEADSNAKVKLRNKVRGLREIEREIATPQAEQKKTATAAEGVVLDYCSAIRGILNDNQGSPVYPAGLQMLDGLKTVRESLQVNMELSIDTPTQRQLERLAECIDGGIERVEGRFQQIRGQVEDIRQVQKTLDPETGNSEQRQRVFDELRNGFAQRADEVAQHMVGVMDRFKPGLFAGGDDLDMPRDNLDEERWFKNPKSHERRITGRRHTGTRIVQEGATMMLAIDAHILHPGPFTVVELKPYRKAQVPESQKAAIHRRKVMRNARSRKTLKKLLTALEERYRKAG